MIEAITQGAPRRTTSRMPVIAVLLAAIAAMAVHPPCLPPPTLLALGLG